MERLSPEFRDAFGQLMDKEMSMTSNEFFKKGMAIMTEHKLLKHATKVHPRFFMTHKENRNRLMLSPLNVHKKGFVIRSIGADRKQLTSALCVELAPSGPTRVSNLQANLALIQKANGLLAPLNGEELYLTLGCSHTVAFCKVAPLGGPTPEKGLQDDNGKLDYGKLIKQPEYKAMIEDGWDWDVIPWDVDQMFPRFAKVVQKALNGSNSASTEIGELDTAVNFADLQVDLAGVADWEKLALQNVKGMCMSCAPYSEVILEFVKLYGGGPGAPHISFMDSIGKAFNSNMLLGEQFWRGLTYTEFADKNSMYPLLRVGLGLVNLTSDKHENRIAKCLIKSDITKLASKNSTAKAKEAEQTLKDSLEIVDALANSMGTARQDVLQPLGHMFVRVGLAATDKGKSGPEGKDYTMKEIQYKFLEDIGNIVGNKVQFPKWDCTSAPVHQPVGSPQTEATAATSLHDHNSATWLAKSKGFEVGKVVQERVTDGSAKAHMEIISIDDATSTVCLKQVVDYNQIAATFEGKVTTVRDVHGEYEL